MLSMMGDAADAIKLHKLCI